MSEQQGSSLTVLSQTGEPAVDPGMLTRRAMEPDLRIRTLVDSLDSRHETTDQMVANWRCVATGSAVTDAICRHHQGPVPRPYPGPADYQWHPLDGRQCAQERSVVAAADAGAESTVVERVVERITWKSSARPSPQSDAG